MRYVMVVVLLLMTGCASNWSTRDTVLEAAWLGVHAVDAKQTANIQHTPDVEEGNVVTRHLIGSNPSSSDTYQIMATYALSHYLISAMLPPKYRVWWQGGTLAASTIVVANNERMGL